MPHLSSLCRVILLKVFGISAGRGTLDQHMGVESLGAAKSDFNPGFATHLVTLVEFPE